MASSNNDVVAIFGGLIVVAISLTIGYFSLNAEPEILYVDENGRPLSQGEISKLTKRIDVETAQLNQQTRVRNEPANSLISNRTNKSGSYYPVVDINHICKRKWKTDYRMIKYCTGQQKGARQKAHRMNIDQDISKLCAKRWNADWKMFHYCVNQQMHAKHTPSELPTEPTVNIDRFCDEKWPDNYSMQVNCVERQHDAKSDVRTMFVSERVGRHCAKSWPSNWSMYGNCVKRQEAAQRKLGL